MRHILRERAKTREARPRSICDLYLAVKEFYSTHLGVSNSSPCQHIESSTATQTFAALPRPARIPFAIFEVACMNQTVSSALDLRYIGHACRSTYNLIRLFPIGVPLQSLADTQTYTSCANQTATRSFTAPVEVPKLPALYLKSPRATCFGSNHFIYPPAVTLLLPETSRRRIKKATTPIDPIQVGNRSKHTCMWFCPYPSCGSLS